MKSILDTKTDHKQRCFIAFDLEYPQNIHIELNISRFLSKKKTNNSIFFSKHGKEKITLKNKRTEKLVMDQSINQKCFLHYTDLKF